MFPPDDSKLLQATMNKTKSIFFAIYLKELFQEIYVWFCCESGNFRMF